MQSEAILELVDRVAAAPVGGSRSALSEGFADVRRLRSWVEAQEIRLAAAAASVASFPEKFIAEATGGSMRDATVLLARARVVAQLPGLSAALAAGSISAEHLDVAVRRLQRLEPKVRDRLLLDAAQQAGVGLSWRLASEGMHEWRLLLDPVAALAFDQLIAAQVEAMFHDRVPEGCPTNPLQRQAYLRAHALLALLNGGGARMGRPEIIVVVDARDGEAADDSDDASEGASSEREPVVDWGLPVEVPQRVLLDLFDRADVHTVVVRNGIVLHAPGSLQLGRSTRLANGAQRRVLRGLYATCAVPGCAARFAHTKIHHVHWWRRGGCTDLDKLRCR